MGYEFSRNHRLLTPGDYKAVFDGTTCKASAPLILLLARENTLTHPRLGLVIAKKHVRHAVDRNRIKRIARESFRHHQDALGTLDIVILARKGLGNLDNGQLHALYQDMWRRLARSASKRARSPNSGPPSSNA
ncbi:MAG: ribonuclease P protein component [Gammaproteobacteria bacterium]|nr:ribonuclease P protein component [Gammaproteobacteria bacterium]